MPTVVYQQPDVLTGGLQGIAGAFAGQAQGLEFKEGQRKFDEDLAQRKAQFDADLEFRVSELTVLQEQNALNREQQSKLAELQRMLQASMQDKDINATFARQVSQQKFESGENVKERELKRELTTAQLAEAELENRRSVAAQNFATRARQEEARASYALQREQLFGKKERLDAAGEAVSKYGDPTIKPWTPEQAEQAFQGYLLRTAPAGSTTGQQDVPQLTPMEVARTREEFNALTKNLSAERARLVKDTAEVSLAQAQGELAARAGTLPATGLSGAAGTPPQRQVRDLVDFQGKPDPVTQKYPLRAETLQVFPELKDVDLMLVDHAVNATFSLLEAGATVRVGTGTPEGAHIEERRHIDDFEVALDRRLDELAARNPQEMTPKTRELLKEYYMTAAWNALKAGEIGGMTGELETGEAVQGPSVGG